MKKVVSYDVTRLKSVTTRKILLRQRTNRIIIIGNL